MSTLIAAIVAWLGLDDTTQAETDGDFVIGPAGG